DCRDPQRGSDRTRLAQRPIRLGESVHRSSGKHPHGDHQRSRTLYAGDAGPDGRQRAADRQPACPRPGHLPALGIHRLGAAGKPRHPRALPAARGDESQRGRRMMSRKPRGSALLAALIVIGVLALVTVATLQLAGISKQQSAKDSRTLSQTACVEAARQYVLGRLRVFGLDPTTITLNQTIQVDSGGRQLRTGHINGPVVTSIQAIAPQLVGGTAPQRAACTRPASAIAPVATEPSPPPIRRSPPAGFSSSTTRPRCTGCRMTSEPSPALRTSPAA